MAGSLAATRQHAYQELGLGEMVIVKGDPARPIFVQYDDLD